ncbi:hypothetical protein MKY84_10680 [Chryseomicrobium sp. FSL W7-1435]
MNETRNWWEEVFTGPISLGLNKEKMAELEEEQFIYFAATQEQEEIPRHS